MKRKIPLSRLRCIEFSLFHAVKAARQEVRKYSDNFRKNASRGRESFCMRDVSRMKEQGIFSPEERCSAETSAEMRALVASRRRERR